MKQTLKYIYEELLEIMKIAEGKYSITLALASGVIVLGNSFISNNNIYVKALAGGTIIFSLISIIYGFFALKARHIKIRIKTKPPTNVENLTYYKSIIKFDEKTFLNEIIKRYNFPKSYKVDEFDLDLSRSVIAQAKTLYYKFLYFNISLFFLLLAVVLAVCMVFVLGGF